MDPTLLGNLWQFYQNIAQKQYDWGQQQFANNSALTDQVVNQYLTNSGILQGAGQHDLDRYQNVFQPQENQLIADANSYAGPARMQANMGAAEATASQAGENQRQASLADLTSYGIDPSSGRYASLDMASRAREAASAAGAGNTARAQTEATGRALRSEAIQVGQRYPGQVVNDLATSMQALTGAENSKLANANTGVNMMGNPTQWAGLGLQAYNSQLSRLTQQPNRGAVHSGGGGGGGGYGAIPATPEGGESSMDWNGSAPSSLSGSGSPGASWSSPSFAEPGGGSGGYTDPEGFGGGGQDYGQYATGDEGGTGEFFAAGGAIPSTMSPSRGQQTDDVPAVIHQTGQHARLNVDEFVIPQDVAKWKGQEFFQKLIDASRTGMSGATAKPQMKPALSQGQGAIPVQ